MVRRAVLSTALIALNVERYDPNCQGGQVPICFVPEVIPPSMRSKGNLTVKLKMSPTVEKSHKVLLEGGTEAFINHIKAHKKILFGYSVEAETVIAGTLITKNQLKIPELDVPDPVANQAKV